MSLCRAAERAYPSQPTLAIVIVIMNNQSTMYDGILDIYITVDLRT